MSLRISRNRVTTLLVSATVVLLGLNIAVLISKYYFGHDHLLGLVPLFNFYEEANAPTWFSSTLLLVGSALAAVIHFSCKRQGLDTTRYWGGISLIALLLSLDEIAQLHEKTGGILRMWVTPTGILKSPWVILGGIFVASIALLYSRFLLKLPQRIRLLFFWAAAIYVSGALGFELIENIYVSSHGATPVFFVMTSVEEFMEMLGVIVFIHGLLSYLETYPESVSFQQ